MFIYAETALHHEGNLDYLIKLIDCAKKSNAEGVKFQVTIDHDEVMSTRHSLYNTCKACIDDNACREAQIKNDYDYGSFSEV